jgi:hypothetical protein
MRAIDAYFAAIERDLVRKSTGHALVTTIMAQGCLKIPFGAGFARNCFWFFHVQVNFIAIPTFGALFT